MVKGKGKVCWMWVARLFFLWIHLGLKTHSFGHLHVWRFNWRSVGVGSCDGSAGRTRQRQVFNIWLCQKVSCSTKSLPRIAQIATYLHGEREEEWKRLGPLLSDFPFSFPLFPNSLTLHSPYTHIPNHKTLIFLTSQRGGVGRLTSVSGVWGRGVIAL